jgi:CheY-like chemotaxis protein
MPSPGGNHTVLIVDDEKIIGETLGSIFTTRGYEARAAQSAEEAIEVLAEWQPNLAILDVRLPKMNGIDLAIALKNSHPACRVLLLSGYPNTVDLVARAQADGHLFEVLAKPVHPTVIRSRRSFALPNLS